MSRNRKSSSDLHKLEVQFSPPRTQAVCDQQGLSLSYFGALSPSPDGFCLLDQNGVQIQSSHHTPASKRGERAGEE